MKLHPRLSRAAVDLVTRFEAFQAEARPAAGGGWTVGFGHTRSAREGAAVTRADAEALLLYDLNAAAAAVEEALYAPASPRQFEAFTAFSFNIGAENFRASSALAAFNAGAELDAADEIERWRRAELGAGAQVVDALVRRRAAEKAHFLGLPEGFSKTPSALVRPLPAGGPAAPAPRPSGSATLDAANGIQARLRALVPEPPPFPDPPPAPEAPTAPPDAGEMAGNVAATPPPAVDPLPPEPRASPPAEAQPPPYVAPPPPPPPPMPERLPANDPGPPEASGRAPAVQERSGEAAARTTPLRRLPRLSARGVFSVLAALGAGLLAIAAVLILGGRPDLRSLVLGVMGALLLPLALYGLMGSRHGRPREPDL